MDYLVKFAQVHEDFRLAELKAIAEAEGIELIVIEYSDEVRISSVAIRSGTLLTGTK
jgi:tRNA (guanine10-N2)-methyltransferase